MEREGKKEKFRGVRYVRRMSWIFSTPSLIVMTLFGWIPLAATFLIAFQKYHVIFGAKYVGWENFRSLFQDQPLLPTAFINTFYYCFLSIILTFMIPIIIATLLMEMRKSVIRIMMILWFIPVASMAGLIIWRWFYNVDYGFFNGILSKLGFPTLLWLNDSRLTMLCLVLPGLIMFAPGLIYIATLQSIPEELYEAAELEGCSLWQKIWYITLPRMRPIIAVMLMLSVISKLQVFDQPYVMTGGGPNYATFTIVMMIVKQAFYSMRFGLGSALTVLIFVIIMSLIILQRKLFKENIDR